MDNWQFDDLVAVVQEYVLLQHTNLKVQDTAEIVQSNLVNDHDYVDIPLEPSTREFVDTKSVE